MFKIDYSHDNNVDWFDRVKNLNEFCIYNLSEPVSLFPLLGNIANDEHSLTKKSIYYHLSYLKNKKIVIVASDINYLKNFEKIKQIYNYDHDISLLNYPWMFLNQYFLLDEYLLANNNFKIENKAIFLSGGKKLCRLFIIKELYKYDKFLYSNPGYFDTSNEDEEYVIQKCELKNNRFEVIINEKPFKMTGDFSIGSMNFKYDNFDTKNNVYFPIFKNFYKNVDVVDFKTPVHAYELVPEEYLQSAISFFCETQTVLTSHLTEKTIKNFYYKKPFFAFACQGYYDFLVKNDFLLYDELFDYSLDNFDYEKRLRSYVFECKKILNMSLSDIIEITHGLKDKIEHNFHVCVNISKKYSKIHGIKKNRIDYILDRL